ncbi:hypothetical protein [Micromonospora zamorensis]|uniref:hypothetical protein n=1 Tax=Micromonospora zamorensis TaxID=709883 RepID=UPI002E2C99F7|nr:hypothetical protein [Micromonospora zamorensis]
MPQTPAEDLLRELVPQVLGALVRRYGHFDTAEDAVQEAPSRSTNLAQQRYLNARADRLAGGNV